MSTKAGPGQISAHRDGDLDVLQISGLWSRITRKAVWGYFDAFGDHLDLLRARYPHEMTLYFEVRRRPSVIAKNAGAVDYPSFDPVSEGLPPFEA